MDQETSRIRAHIDAERVQLDANLDEFEQRVRSATDLGTHFQARPWLFAGAVFGLGSLLGFAFGGRSGAAKGTSRRFPRTSADFREAGTVLDNVVTALVVLGARALADTIADVVPGFDQEFERASGSREPRQEGTRRPATAL